MTLPRSVALLGPDVVLLAMESLGGGKTTSGNGLLAIELAGIVEPRRVEAALTRLLTICPWLGGRLVRPWPWGKLCWRVPARGPTPPPVHVTRLAAPEDLGALVDRELAACIDPRRAAPLRLTLATTDATTFLILTWAHALMDPHGSEHLVRLLADLDAHPDATPPWPSPPCVVAPPETRSFRERGALASRGAAHLKTLAPVPPLSLATHTGPPSGRRRQRRFRFAAGPLPVERLRRGMPWRLAVVAKAMTALWTERGLATDVPFLIPLSIDRRPRGEHGPVIGNYLGFHFARCLPPLDGDTARLARELRDQLVDAVRGDEIEAGWAGLAFARYRPLRSMFRELPWTANGDLCSFHFADTDALLADRTHLFGARIVDGYHVAVVPDRPGVGVFFSRAGAIESVVVSWADDVLDDADAAKIAGIVRDEMGWKDA